jgi:peroxiredoxin
MIGRRKSTIAAFAIGALITALDAAAAERPAVLELLKALNVSAYPAVTYPPEFSSITADGRTISMTDLEGRVVLVNFWATWCLECRSEMPAFERVHRQFSSQGLTVIGINAREGTSTIREYAKELGLTFSLVTDPAGKINSTYGVIGLPTTFLIARNGRAVALAIGPREWNGKLAWDLIQALLTEPAVPKGHDDRFDRRIR